jgi:hypothetical protein
VTVGNQSLAQFKSKWGAQTKMIYRYSYPAVSDIMRTISTPGQPRSAARQLVRPILHPIRRTIWQHLPIKAIELLSDWSRGLHYY